MYKNYLKSENWKNKREEVFELKGKFCEKCGNVYNLNIHHASYKKKYKEPLEHLFILCNNCHNEFHTKYKMGKSMINKTLNFIYGKGWRKLKKFNELKKLYKN